MINKKAQELSIGTLILIVLGIIVLVLLVLGFSMGWENLFSKIGIFQGSDLSSVATACKTAAASQSQASYCEFKTVKLETGKEFLNCEDSRVSPENKLSGCQTVKDKCIEIVKAGKLNKDDKYNGKTCYTILVISTVPLNKEVECSMNSGGTLTANDKTLCTTEQLDITAYVKAPSGTDAGKKCCIALSK